MSSSSPSNSASEPATPPEPTRQIKRGWGFWLIFVALCASVFLSALDLSSVATALPVIVHDLNGTDSFAWVSAAYTLTCTAFLPLSGQLADIFGRKSILLLSLLLFALGSIICAISQSMNMMIAGRAVQGVGSGGIQSLVSIVVADMVTLRERGLFISFTGAAYSVATAAGPFVAGAFAEKVTWRWQVNYSANIQALDLTPFLIGFSVGQQQPKRKRKNDVIISDLNLPLTGVAFIVVLFVMRLRKPPIASIAGKLCAVDWVGNLLIIGSSASCVLALTWAGVEFSWRSVQVLGPLLGGLLGLLSAFIYEAFVARTPCISMTILSNRTSLSGYSGTFVHGMVSIIVFFYLPLYFQASKLATPLQSGLYFFPMAGMISPAAIAQGLVISKTGKYRLVSVVGWCTMLLGTGLLCLLKPNTNIGVSVAAQLVAAIGVGILYCTQFSILAPLEPTLNAQALSFLLFLRSLSQTCGVAIGAAILQNRLKHHLPVAFISMISPVQDISYTAVPLIGSLPESIKGQVRETFADSLGLLWKACMVMCVIGLLSVGAQKNIPLHQKRDYRWGLEHGQGKEHNDEQSIGHNGSVDKEARCVTPA